MKINKKMAAFMLLISLVNLSIMIPGGPIETRQFSQYPAFVLGGFNTFLTLLGLGSIIGVYFILKNKKWALWLSFYCGIGYEAVYLLDLFKIFPTSPVAMPTSLFILETIGAIVAIPLMIFSYLAVRDESNETSFSNSKKQLTTRTILTTLIFAIIGIAIIAFATVSAMNS